MDGQLLGAPAMLPATPAWGASRTDTATAALVPPGILETGIRSHLFPAQRRKLRQEPGREVAECRGGPGDVLSLCRALASSLGPLHGQCAAASLPI